MRIPKRTRIAGHTIRVIYGTSQELRDAGKHGDYHQDLKRIRIAKEGREQREETYVHELIEAADSIHQLGMDHGTINALGLALHQALTSGKGKL